MISNEQAYVLGLLVGGGTLSSDAFSIVLPYDKWGSNPVHMSAIATNILTQIQSKFFSAYGFHVQYEILNKGRWKISATSQIDISLISKDLADLGLPIYGQLISSADLTSAKKQLKGLRAENFLSGIFDARASLTESHRRFFNNAPVVSIEIPGSTRNFNFVMQLCSWLTDMQSVTDQILYNHPCQHSSTDPTYMGWKKGFKIRFLAKSFISNHAFSMQAKAEDISRLESRQSAVEQKPCKLRTCSSGPISIHTDINSEDLPLQVRNKLFLHYHHICAALGCEYAPIDSVKLLVSNATEYISVFPLLAKGDINEISTLLSAIIESNFKPNSVSDCTLTVSQVVDHYRDAYPDIKTGIAYLFCEKLNGKRHTGNQDDIINMSLKKAVLVRTIDDTSGAPMFIGREYNGRGIIVSSVSGNVNQSLLRKKILKKGINIDVK